MSLPPSDPDLNQTSPTTTVSSMEHIDRASKTIKRLSNKFLPSSPSSKRDSAEVEVAPPAEKQQSPERPQVTTTNPNKRSSEEPGARSVPASLSKYFKTTAKAQRLMRPVMDNRVCELDSRCDEGELVFSTYAPYGENQWTQGKWSQKTLWEAANDDPTMRISRKAPTGLKFEIFYDDYLNGDDKSDNPYLWKSDNANAHSRDHDDNILTIRSLPTPDKVFELGFEQAKRKWIYLISEKQVPYDHERFSISPFPNPKVTVTKCLSKASLPLSPYDGASERSFEFAEKEPEDDEVVIISNATAPPPEYSRKRARTDSSGVSVLDL